MSYVEIDHSEGLPYGGIPYGEVARKMEISEHEDYEDEYGVAHDSRELYDDYARRILKSMGPDPPYLESDHPSRNSSSHSRSVLNLHFNGTRGSSADLPRHPEMFIGFLGDDPRGANNLPRFEKMREHTKARFPRMEVRMGDNDINSEAERPWTEQGISYAKKEILRRAKNMYVKVFTMERENRILGRNEVLERIHNLRKKVQQEVRFDRPSGEIHGFSNRKEAFAVPNNRETTTDSWFGSQEEGRTPNSNFDASTGLIGGGKIGSIVRDGANPELADTVGRNLMASVMGTISKAKYKTQMDGEEKPPLDAGASGVAKSIKKSLPSMGEDILKIYRNIEEDTTRRQSGEVQDDEMARTNFTTAFSFPLRNSEQSHVVNAHEKISESMRLGMAVRESSAAKKREAQNKQEREILVSGSMDRITPSGNNNNVFGVLGVVDTSEVSFVTSGAAKGLSAKNYSAYIPDKLFQQNKNVLPEYLQFSESRSNRGSGKSGKPEWISHTKDDVEIDNEFGRNNVSAGGWTVPASRSKRPVDRGEDLTFDEDGLGLN